MEEKSTICNSLQLNYAWTSYHSHPQPLWPMGNNTKQIPCWRQRNTLLSLFTFTTIAVAFLGTQPTKYFISNTPYGSHALLSTTLGPYKLIQTVNSSEEKLGFHMLVKSRQYIISTTSNQSIAELGLINFIFVFFFGLLWHLYPISLFFLESLTVGNSLPCNLLLCSQMELSLESNHMVQP